MWVPHQAGRVLVVNAASLSHPWAAQILTASVKHARVTMLVRFVCAHVCRSIASPEFAHRNVPFTGWRYEARSDGVDVGRAKYGSAMNLQSRSKRWLAAANLAKTITSGTLTSEEQLRAVGRPMPEQAQEVICKGGLHDLRLTMEADPVSPDTPLHEVLGGVVQALDELKVGPEFRASLEALDAALGAAISSLSEWTADDDSNIEEIVDELERAFLISLFITLTSHTFLSDWGEKWKQHHQRFLAGHLPTDLPHYVHMKTFIPCPDPGPGRVHVQHINSALTAGTTVFIAGATPTNVDHYPELQSIVYSQWFTYIHAIWDEQFRERIAAFFSTPEQPLAKNDVTNDFFGDIRRIRNDYVHRKGVADESAKVKLPTWSFDKGEPLDITTEQLLSLVDLFPREALMVKPTLRPSQNQNRKNVPGSVDAVLIDRFLAKLESLKLDKNEAMDEAFSLWLGSRA
jgi:hypothetical protein